MDGRLLVIVPSRGRPDNAFRLAEAFQQTTTVRSTLLFAIDRDDPQFDQYLARPLLHYAFETRQRLGPSLNHVARLMLARVNYAVIGFMGDDHLPKTPSWDQAILDAAGELGSGFVYGNDLNQGERLPTACFMTADCIDALGYMVPAGLIHLYIDDAWRELGVSMGRFKYLPEVVIEHLHPSLGKAEHDDGYTEANSAQQYHDDHERFARWRVDPDGLPADLAKLKSLL